MPTIYQKNMQSISVLKMMELKTGYPFGTAVKPKISGDNGLAKPLYKRDYNVDLELV